MADLHIPYQYKQAYDKRVAKNDPEVLELKRIKEQGQMDPEQFKIKAIQVLSAKGKQKIQNDKIIQNQKNESSNKPKSNLFLNLNNKMIPPKGDKEDIRKINNIGAQLKKQADNTRSYIQSGKLPKGIKGQEYLGGTMDTNGNPIDMRQFKNEYLVSCGNANEMYGEKNKQILLDKNGFIEKFYSLVKPEHRFIGSWFENGVNTNEPTIWVKNKKKAMKIARLTGQLSITDCAMYNKYGLKNYELATGLSDSQFAEIFPKISENEEHNSIDLSKIKF